MAVVTGAPVTCSGAAYSGVMRAPGFDREQRRRAGLSFAFQQLGNAEVQQLHLAVFSDQHVRRLEVAVHDQVGMRMGNRVQHVKEEADARFHIQRVLVAVSVDVLAFDIFQDEIRLPGLQIPPHPPVPRCADAPAGRECCPRA